MNQSLFVDELPAGVDATLPVPAPDRVTVSARGNSKRAFTVRIVSTVASGSTALRLSSAMCRVLIEPPLIVFKRCSEIAFLKVMCGVDPARDRKGPPEPVPFE